MKRDRPNVFTSCPYYNARQTMDKLHTRFYECGTTADRDSGNYERKCK